MSADLNLVSAMDSEEERAQEQEQQEQERPADSAAASATAGAGVPARMDWMLPPAESHSSSSASTAMDSMSLNTLSLNPRPTRPPRASRPRSVTFADDGAKPAAEPEDDPQRSNEPQLSSPPAPFEQPEQPQQLASLLPLPAPVAATVAASPADSAMNDGRAQDDTSPILSLDSSENRNGASAKLLRSSSKLDAASALVASVAHAAADAAATAASAAASFDPDPLPLRLIPKQRRLGSRPTKPEVARMLKKLHAEHALQSEILESQPTESDESDTELPDVTMARRRSVSFAPELERVSFFRSDEESHRLHLTATSSASSGSSSSSASSSAASTDDEDELGTAALLMEDDEFFLFRDGPESSPAIEAAAPEESPPVPASRNLRYSPPPPARAGSPSPSPTSVSAAAAAAGLPVPVLRSILKKRRNAEMDVASPPGSPSAAQRTASATALGLQADLAASALAEQQQSQPVSSFEKRQRRGHQIVQRALADTFVLPAGSSAVAAAAAAACPFGSNSAFAFRPSFSFAPVDSAAASALFAPPADLSMSDALRSLVYPGSMGGAQSAQMQSEAQPLSGASFSGFDAVPAQSGFSPSSSAAAAAAPSSEFPPAVAIPLHRRALPATRAPTIARRTRVESAGAPSTALLDPTLTADRSPLVDERKDNSTMMTESGSSKSMTDSLAASTPTTPLSSSSSSSSAGSCDAMISSLTPSDAAHAPQQQSRWTVEGSSCSMDGQSTSGAHCT